MKKEIINTYERIVKLFARLGFRKIPGMRKANILFHKLFIMPFFNKHKKDKVMIGKHTIFLDKKDSLGLSFQKFEATETNLIKKLIKKDDVVLDIGANIGYYTLILADLVGKNGQVYAFEPDPENFKLLKKNIEFNGYRNVKLFNNAVGSKKGKIKLYISEDNMGNHKIFQDDSKRNYVEVDMITLDSILSKKKIDFMKLDVEGSEPGVIAGGEKTLRNSSNLKFITELYPLFIEQFGEDYKEYLRNIENMGFSLYLIEDNQQTTRKISINEISKITNPIIGNHIDLLCVKDKK